ncbi:MAG TPA: methyltransferase domain-containing protein [Stenomitos sp.]
MKLHIGGKEIKEGWTILDIEERPEVDIVSDASKLDSIEDNSVSVIYASHILEHMHYALNDKLKLTLLEWNRVLEPEGKLLISVPDLKTLCWLFLHPGATVYDRHHIMRIIFGGQTNEHDIHFGGFDFDILAVYLEEAGFSDIEKIAEFNLFNDCSSLVLLDTLISLNVIASK